MWPCQPRELSFAAPMYTTTITVNGVGGSRFLPVLAAKLGNRLAPVLAPLLDGRVQSLEVDRYLAEEVAELLHRLLSDGSGPHPALLDPADPPLLFSPNIGDTVAIVRDALVEFQGASRRAPRIWRYVPRGTKGVVIAHQGETDRVLLQSSREIVFVRPRTMTGIRFWSDLTR